MKSKFFSRRRTKIEPPALSETETQAFSKPVDEGIAGAITAAPPVDGGGATQSAVFSGTKGDGTTAPAVVPKHIAIIMDGNGRWARRRGLPRTAGHAAGAENFRTIATYCKNIGVEFLTVYAFSTENWKRPEGEVSTIMQLLEKYLAEAIESMEREGVRLRILGDTSALSPKLLELIERTDAKSREISGMQANVCINYGGRAELVYAAARCAGDGVPVTEDNISARLYSAGIPDPDLVIRPGGEARISNFLLWQSAYSEFYFTDVLWPDFSPREMDKAIEAFNKRERRYGGLV